MQKIVTNLWFDHQAEDAVKFYTSLFKNSKILDVTRYGEAGPGPAGSVLTISFQLEGQEFVAINGGPMFTFTEAISLAVNCETQDEIDRYWEQLHKRRRRAQHVRVAERQIRIVVASCAGEFWKLMSDPNPAKANAVMQALLKMRKLEIATLQQAYNSAG